MDNEIAIEINWNDAPYWANYFTISHDGKMIWHELEPYWYPAGENHNAGYGSSGRQKFVNFNAVWERDNGR